MKTTRVMVTQKPIDQVDGDMMVVLAAAEDLSSTEVPGSVADMLTTIKELGDFSGKDEETLLLYPFSGNAKPGMAARRLLLVGLGKTGAEGVTTDDLRETLRKAGGVVAAQAAKVKAASVLISLPAVCRMTPGEVAECLTEGVLLGDYRFRKYKKTEKKEDDFEGISTVRLHAGTSAKAVRSGMTLGLHAAMAACEARDMANEPGNGWTAQSFDDYARDLEKTYGFSCRVIEKDEMVDLGMGGILAVNQGSADPPKLVILEYDPPGKTGTLMLVGKGLVFDSGGVSLKPAAGMEDMKYDMCGGAAVLSVMQAVGQERPDLGVVAVIPATDNMGGPAAVKPGNVIRHYNGVTSEIVNTDAEGRMILADALAFGIETYKPDWVIDLATLTGAMVVGLGHHYTGLFGNNQDLKQRIEEAGSRAGEPVWPMPMGKAYAKQIESKVADIKNTGGKYAGAITAAHYLEKFVGKTAWAHLDIAGTAWDFTEKAYIPKGPSGIGVRLLLELIRKLPAGNV